MARAFGAPSGWRKDSSGKLVQKIETPEFEEAVSIKPYEAEALKATQAGPKGDFTELVNSRSCPGEAGRGRSRCCTMRWLDAAAG